MTMSQPLIDALNSAFSRKYHSLARYIIDARPYVPAGMEGLTAAINDAAAEDQRFADRLAETIETYEGVPQLAIFDPEVASLNYLALDYLAGVLRQSLEKQLAEYEQSQALTAGFPKAKEVFDALVETTRAQIERLGAAKG